MTMREAEARALSIYDTGDETTAFALLERYFRSVGDSRSHRTATNRLWTITHAR